MNCLKWYQDKRKIIILVTNLNMHKLLEANSIPSQPISTKRMSWAFSIIGPLLPRFLILTFRIGVWRNMEFLTKHSLASSKLYKIKLRSFISKSYRNQIIHRNRPNIFIFLSYFFPRFKTTSTNSRERRILAKSTSRSKISKIRTVSWTSFWWTSLRNSKPCRMDKGS